MSPSQRRDAWIMLGLCAFALGLRLLVLVRWPLDGLYGQDAYAYFNHAVALRDLLASGTPLPPFFWPIGYPALFMPAFVLAGPSAAAGQALSLLMGAALSPLVYALARVASVNRPGAVVAGVCMAANGQAIQSSVVLMADVPALFWACLSTLMLLFGLHHGRARWMAASGLVLGLAVITRWANLLLLVPFALAFINARGHWRHAAVALVGLALVLLPQFLISATSPYPTLNHAWVTGWSPVNAVLRDFINVDGAFHYAQPNGLFYAAPAFDAYFLAPLAIPLLVIGLFALRGPARWLFASWALAGWLFLTGIPYQNIRFRLMLTHPLAVLAGAGFGWVWLTANERRVVRWALGAAVAFGIAWMLAAALPIIGTFMDRQLADRDAVRWAAARMPPSVTVYASGLTLALQHELDRPIRELYGIEPAALVAEASTGDRVLINRWQIEHQWEGTVLQEAIIQLEAAHGLTRMGRSGNYTLYRIAH